MKKEITIAPLQKPMAMRKLKSKKITVVADEGA